MPIDYNDYQLGDIVQFTAHFYKDPYIFVPALEGFPELEKLGVSSGGIKFKRALYHVEAVVCGFWDREGVWLDYKLFGHEIRTNHFYFEVQPTGDRRVYNDPTKYHMSLLDWGFQQQLLKGVDG